MTANSVEKFIPPDLKKEKPFRGLLSYQDTETDRAIFGGRKKDIKALVDSVRHNVLTVFYGHSGTGKTSLLKAGAMPILREAGYRPIYIRLKFKPEDDTRDLVEQVKQSIEEDEEWEKMYGKNFEVDTTTTKKETLWEYFTKYSTTKTEIVPVLIFDQFEEIFTLGSALEEWVNDLILELHYLIENQFPKLSTEKLTNNPVYFNPPPQKFRVIFSIREDYAPKLNRHKNKIYSIDKAKVGLEDLKVGDVKDVITKIQQHFNIGYFDGQDIELLENYLKSGQHNHGRQDPVSITLGLLCYQLNEYRLSKNKPKIDKAWLKPRFLESLIGKYYSNANIKRRTKRLIENTLVDKYGHRLSIPEEHFTKKKNVSEKEMQYLVNERRILRYESRLGSKDIEIVHDKLAAKIVEYKNTRRTWIKVALMAAALIFIVGVSLFAWVKIENFRQQALKEQRAAYEKIAEANLAERNARDLAEEIKYAADRDVYQSKQDAKNEADKIKDDAQEEIDETKSLLELAVASNKKATDGFRRSTEGLIAATVEAHENFSLFKKERVKVLKAYAKSYLESNPQDYKRALLYALHGLRIDSTDNELKSLLDRAVAANRQFYTMIESAAPDSMSIYFRNGKKIVISNTNRKGFITNYQPRKKYLFDGLAQSGDPVQTKGKKVPETDASRSWRFPLEQAVRKSGDEKLLSYYDDPKFRIWNVESGSLELLFSSEQLNTPIFSKDNLNLAFYENSKFRVTPIYKDQIDLVRPLKKKTNWSVLDLSSVGVGDSGRYVVLVANEKNDSRKQIVIRKLSGGGEKDMVSNPGARILAMDYFVKTGNVLGYYQTAVRLRNWEKNIDVELDIGGWREAQQVSTLMIPERKAVIVFKKGKSRSQLFLIKEDDSATNGFSISEFVELPSTADRMSSMRVYKNKLLVSYQFDGTTRISLFDIANLGVAPTTIDIREQVMDATFWLNKYVLFQTQTGAYLWHFNMSAPGNNSKAIEKFYAKDRKEYPEFWELSALDRSLFDASEEPGD